MTDQTFIRDDGTVGSQPTTWDGEPLYSAETVREGLFDAEAFAQMPGQLFMCDDPAEGLEPVAIGRMEWCIASYHDEPEFSAQLVSDEGACGYIVLAGSDGRRHQVPTVRREIDHERHWREHDGYYVEQMRDKS